MTLYPKTAESSLTWNLSSKRNLRHIIIARPWTCQNSTHLFKHNASATKYSMLNLKQTKFTQLSLFLKALTYFTTKRPHSKLTHATTIFCQAWKKNTISLEALHSLSQRRNSQMKMTVAMCMCIAFNKLLMGLILIIYKSI